MEISSEVDCMDKELKRFIYVTILIIGTVLISLIFSDTTASSMSNSTQFDSTKNSGTYTITQLLSKRPLDQNIKVAGNISAVLKDYTSKKGYVYQRLKVSDGSNEILIFCSAYKGKSDLTIGDRVSVEGKFQKYKDEYEIYTYCSQIQKIK